MSSLFGLQITCSDLVLPMLWFWLDAFAAHGLYATLLSCTMSFSLTFKPLSVVSLFFLWFSLNFPSHLWKANFESLMLLWWYIWTMLWVVQSLLLGLLVENVHVLKSSQCLFDLLSQLLLCGYGGTMYVFRVLHKESAILHHPYAIGMSPVVTVVECDYYTICPWPSIFTLDCYCSSWNGDRRILLNILPPSYFLWKASKAS